MPSCEVGELREACHVPGCTFDQDAAEEGACRVRCTLSLLATGNASALPPTCASFLATHAIETELTLASPDPDNTFMGVAAKILEASRATRLGLRGRWSGVALATLLNTGQAATHVSVLDGQNVGIRQLPSDTFFKAQNLTILDLSYNEIDRWQAELLAGQQSLRILKLVNNRLTALPYGMFGNLESMITIDVSRNAIQSLPEKLLFGLNNLVDVTLETNRLESLPADLLHWQTRLISLSLAQNRLSSISPAMFSVTTNIQVLGLHDNRLTSLPSLEALTMLRALDLSRNRLTALQADTFKGLTEMRDLALHSMQLKEIDTSTFAPLSNLFRVKLQNNALTALPADLFLANTQLQAIDLRNNQLRALPAGIFRSVSQLYAVALQANTLTALPAGLFDACKAQLLHLDLSQNALHDLPAGLLAGAAELRLLDLSDNAFVTFANQGDGLLTNAPKLSDVRLDHNLLTAVPTKLLQAARSSLTSLDLSYNALSQAPAILNQLTLLQRVNLAHNAIASLPSAGLSQLHSLQLLNVSNNRLTSLDMAALRGLSALAVLDLGSNQLATLAAGVLDALTALSSLSLFGNRLSVLRDDLFATQTQLRSVDLSNNRLPTLTPSLFAKAGALEVVNVGENKLTALSPALLAPLKRCAYLMAYRNQLATMDLEAWPALNMLDLGDNALVSLRITKNTGLRHLLVGGNPALTAMEIEEAVAVADVSGTALQVLDCATVGYQTLIARNLRGSWRGAAVVEACFDTVNRRLLDVGSGGAEQTVGVGDSSDASSTSGGAQLSPIVEVGRLRAALTGVFSLESGEGLGTVCAFDGDSTCRPLQEPRDVALGTTSRVHCLMRLDRRFGHSNYGQDSQLDLVWPTGSWVCECVPGYKEVDGVCKDAGSDSGGSFEDKPTGVATVVVTSLIGIALLAGVAFVLYRRQRNSSQSAYARMGGEGGDGLDDGLLFDHGHSDL
jgi:LPXTG-motif cell wall-anchored protein